MANTVARPGHTVYVSMRETTGRNAPQAADMRRFARENGVDLRPIELDVLSQESVYGAWYSTPKFGGELRQIGLAANSVGQF